MQEAPGAWLSPRRTKKEANSLCDPGQLLPLSGPQGPCPQGISAPIRGVCVWWGGGGTVKTPPRASPPPSAPDSPTHPFGGLSLVEVKSSPKAQGWGLPLNLLKAL